MSLKDLVQDAVLGLPALVRRVGEIALTETARRGCGCRHARTERIFRAQGTCLCCRAVARDEPAKPPAGAGGRRSRTGEPLASRRLQGPTAA